MINTTPGITIQGLQLPTFGQTKLPVVKNTSEAERYPSGPNTQDVLLDANDEYVAYFRQTDQNGFTQVERMRCVPEPEVIVQQQQIDTSKYVTRDQLDYLLDGIREEIHNVQQSINDVNSSIRYSNGRNRNRNQSRNATNQGNVQIPYNEQKPTTNDANFSPVQSGFTTDGTPVGGQ